MVPTYGGELVLICRSVLLVDIDCLESLRSMIHPIGELDCGDEAVAAFCECCGAKITLKVEACPACGAPQHGMLLPDLPLPSEFDMEGEKEDDSP